MSVQATEILAPTESGSLPQWALTVEHPFPGLRPFAFPDHPFFFGREDQVYAVYRLLDRSRFIAVVGASGGGKSSLVRAGLLPLLERETKEGGARKWSWFELRPGDAPINSLVGALCGQAQDEPDEFTRAVFEAKSERIRYALNRSSFGLVDALGQLQLPKDQPVVLVIDQFEELFRFGAAERAVSSDPLDEMRRRDESAHFVQLLLEATRDSKIAVHVLITMRSDFIGDCARYHGLPEVVSASQYLVPALTRDQREDVILRPVERANASIDPELVERLINDSNDEFDLPVLQHCLMRLWEESGRPQLDAGKEPPGPEANGVVPDQGQGRHLKLAHYSRVGGIARALSQHAEEILAGVKGYEIAVEQVFRALSEVDKNGRATRRSLTLKRLREETGISDEELRKVIDRFRSDDCSFLVPPPSSVVELGPETRIDVGHEALLRRWARISSDPLPGLHSDQTRREGWLWQEEADARTYRALLALSESAGSQTRVILPLDQVESRWRWWTSRTRTAAWAERYGGGFERVERLLQDSRDELRADGIRKQIAEANERDRIAQARRAELETSERRRVEAEANLLRIRARSIRIIAVLLFVVVIATLYLAYIANNRRIEANDQRAEAIKQQQFAEQKQNEANAKRAEAIESQKLAELRQTEANAQRADAETQRAEAVKQRADADRQRAEALALQSRFLASQSRRETARGNTRFGVLLAEEAFKPLERVGLSLEGLPKDAELALYAALTNAAPGQLLAKIPPADRVALSPNAELIATVSSDNAVRVWNREGQQIGVVQHTNDVVSMSFSQDSTQLVTASWDRTASIWKRADNTIVVLRHEDDVNFAAFGPNGDKVITASDTDGYIWSVNGKKLVALKSGITTQAAFAPDGKRVSTSGLISRVWTVEGKRIVSMDTPVDGGVIGNRGVKAIFSPDGKSVLSLYGDRTPRIWSLEGKGQRPVVGHQDVVVDAAFSFDGSRLITVSRDQTAQVWDTASLERIVTMRHEGGVFLAAFSLDGKRILTASSDGTVRLWSSNGSKLGSVQLPENARIATFDPGGKGIFTIAGGELRLWDFGRPGMDLLIHPSVVGYAAFARSGKHVVTTAGGTARVWARGSNKFAPVDDLEGQAAYFVGDGSRVLLRSRNGGMQLWTADGSKLRDWPGSEDGKLRGVFNPLEMGRRPIQYLSSSDGQRFVAIGGKSILLLDDEGRKLAELAGTLAQFNSRNTRILTSTRDGLVLLWNISGEKIEQLAEPRRRDGNKATNPVLDFLETAESRRENSRLMAADFSSDGNTIFAVDSGGRVQLWTSDGAKVNDFETGGKVESALLHPNGTLVLLVREGAFELWDASGQRISPMDQEIDSKIKPRFSPNGSSVLAVSRDKGVILTDGKTARILRHDASLQSVAFSADGNRILTSCTDGSIRVWDSTGKKLLEIYLEGRISSVSFSPDGAEVLATGGDAIARIFNLYSLAETRSAAADLRLEPLTPVERQRLQVFESGLDVDSMDPIK